MTKVDDNFAEGKLTLIFFYYAGHGEMDNMTYAVVNSDNKDKYRFALEAQLRTLGRIQGAYVIALFDCCRMKVHPDLRGPSAEPHVDAAE